MKTLIRACLILTLSGGVGAFGNPVEAQLMNVPLSALPDDPEMLVLEVALAPGQASAPHRHDAYVFVYVLEGRVNMQVEGGEVVTLSPGEMFFESPGDVHTVSQNASDTDSARFLVHMIKSIGAPVTTQVPDGP